MNAGQVFQIEITDPDGNRRTMLLGARTTLGRQVGNDLVLSDQRVSRQHAAIACDDEGCQIMDLGSSNGTILEGERVPPNVSVPLRPDIQLQIGPFELRLQVHAVQPAVQAPAKEPARVREGADTGDIEGPTPAEAPAEEAARGDVQEAQRRPAAPPPARPPAPRSPATPDELIPPGLDLDSRRLIDYLPGIYHTAFMRRFLGIFEAILTPIEWQIDNFDLFLDPTTAPLGFLPWLAGWFDVAFDPSWDEVRRRRLLQEAHRIYARRGTKWALSRVLEIYTGKTPTIVDAGDGLEPFTFRVILPFSAARSERAMIERLIDAHKPAYTLYSVEFAP